MGRRKMGWVFGVLTALLLFCLALMLGSGDQFDAFRRLHATERNIGDRQVFSFDPTNKAIAKYFTFAPATGAPLTRVPAGWMQLPSGTHVDLYVTFDRTGHADAFQMDVPRVSWAASEIHKLEALFHR